jgi:hypothetical protein
MLSGERSIEGRWRITETEMWDREALDMIVPAHLTLGRDGLGEMQLIAIGAAIDYRVVERDGATVVEFSWSGFDEMDPTSGRGWAKIEGDTMRGRLFIHAGDESGFVAKHALARRAVSGSNRPLQPPAAARTQAARTTKGVRRGRG